jgi:hypothetical protein
VSENRVLRKIFGPKRDEVTGGWRKLHNEGLHDLYSSPNIRMIKSRRTIWAGHLLRPGEMRNAYKILVGKPEGNKVFRRSKLDGRTILKWVLRKYGVRAWIGLIWLRIGTGSGIM